MKKQHLIFSKYFYNFDGIIGFMLFLPVLNYPLIFFKLRTYKELTQTGQFYYHEWQNNVVFLYLHS